VRLAATVADVLRQGKFPLVLGGDCSNIIGIMLALRRAGRYWLCFVDGHAGFYQPETASDARKLSEAALPTAITKQAHAPIACTAVSA
jgi:arginase